MAKKTQPQVIEAEFTVLETSTPTPPQTESVQVLITKPQRQPLANVTKARGKKSTNVLNLVPVNKHQIYSSCYLCNSVTPTGDAVSLVNVPLPVCRNCAKLAHRGASLLLSLFD